MSRIEFENECSLDIHPIFDDEEKFNKGTHFIECSTKESILGSPPEIILIVKTTQDLCELNEEIEGIIIDEMGNPINFIGYVTSISSINDKCVIKILCAKPDFIREERQNKFSGMNSAIEGLYSGGRKNIVFREGSKSNLMDSMEIYQEDMTNHEMLKRLLLGYKTDTIFGFALGKLFINSLKPFKPLDIELSSLIESQPDTAPEFSNPKLYEKESKIIDYSEGKDESHKNVKFFNKHVSIDKSYEDFVANFAYNSRFLSSIKLSAKYTTRTLFPFNITDSVKLYNDALTMNNCFISSREIKFSYQKMEVFYTAQSINPI